MDPRSCSPRRAPCDPPHAAPAAAPMQLSVQSTTGTRYELSVPAEETVEGLERRLAQRLRVPRERLSLLHRERRLSSGRLQDSGVTDGSKLTLVPTVEAGLMSQASRPEQSVIQALESLTETQVNDFLSGRSPLTLALRVGDHMMFVQLQLAAQQNGGVHRHVLSGSSTSRGESGGVASAAHYRTLHTGSSFVRVPGAPCQHTASPATPGTPLHCTTANTAPITAGIFRSHGTTTKTAKTNSGATPCPEVGHSSRSSGTKSSGTSSTPASSRSRKPGAIIESFVNHAPGVFSGTFSGTLHPNCQDSAGRPRRDIGTILQILNDLLSATRHYQGMPQSLTQLRCQTQCTASPDISSDHNTKTTSAKSATTQPLHSVVQCQSQIRLCKPVGDRTRQTENRATRCKVERLQLLMQQKRMRRKARRDARAPYHWLPNRKIARANSHGSVSSEGSLDLEDMLWKPEVAADLASEFVMA
ncbi:midnolin [Ambystoma mexicanum]|uniref:midnolin n=1 Tax=Ambystoma mexicanum TaxID=8296 RepID=UPI0037E9930A